MPDFNKTIQSPKNVAADQSLFKLKLPAINPDAVKANTVKTIDKVVDYVSKNPNVVAAGMAVAAIGNAIKYAAETAPERAEIARLDKIKAEEAQLRAKLDEDQRKAKELEIHNFITPTNKETV